MAKSHGHRFWLSKVLYTDTSHFLATIIIIWVRGYNKLNLKINQWLHSNSEGEKEGGGVEDGRQTERQRCLLLLLRTLKLSYNGTATAFIYLYFLRCLPTEHSHAGAGGVRTLSCDPRETPTFNPWHVGYWEDLKVTTLPPQRSIGSHRMLWHPGTPAVGEKPVHTTKYAASLSGMSSPNLFMK